MKANDLMKIGNTELTHGLFLAPMAGVTDRSFRRVCRRFGAEYTVSEMVSAKAVCYEMLSKKKVIESKTAPLAAVMRDELPMAVQIFGSEPEFMARAATLIESGEYRGCTSEATPSAIDINMGCPVHKIVGNGEGSALMKNPALVGKIIEAVCSAVKIPVTVKIRAGWDSESINAAEIAHIAEESGASAITVHARTRSSMYEPGILPYVITDVKKRVKIPVIGNGDIFSAADALSMFSTTGCDGVMIGRGALGYPWLFEEICVALEDRSFTPPSFEERINTALAQVRDMIKLKGERIGVAEAKKHLAWYIKNINGAASARHEIMNSSSYSQMEKTAMSLLSK